MSTNKFIPIYNPYFDWLTELLGDLAHEAIRGNVSAGTIARDYLNYPSRRQNFSYGLPNLCAFIEAFWESNSEAVNAELKRLPGLKARFGGDFGPKASDAVFQRTGLYFDTIVVPDPMLRIAKTPEGLFKMRDYYFIKYGIEQILAKEVYLADVYPPIAVLVADPELSQPNQGFNGLASLAEVDCIALTNELYGERLDDFGEVQSFFSHFGSLREAVEEITQPHLFYWDEYTPLDPVLQMEAFVHGANIDWNLRALPDEFQGPEYLPFVFLGRMMQINDVLHRSRSQNAHPLVAAPVSFHWLTWKIRANQSLIAKDLGFASDIELGLTNSLLSQNLEWLSNVPLEGLIELRKKGLLTELRALISRELESLTGVDLSNLEAIISQVDYNLSSALRQHQEQVKKLDEEYRMELAVKGPTFLLSIAAALQPSLLPLAPDWAKTLSVIVGTTSLSSVVQATVKYFKERNALGKTPVGLLWHAKEQSID
jgi:hypothetical protein